MRCSATSRRTSSEKCTFTSERGTWPFRNPGRRAIFCTRPYASSHSFCTTSTGASMARRRLQPSIGSTATFIDAPVWCERGESNPQGRWAHWILSPARLPVSPLSQDRAHEAYPRIRIIPNANCPPRQYRLGSRHGRGDRGVLPRANRRDRARRRASLARLGAGLPARRHLSLLGRPARRRLPPRAGGADLLAAGARLSRAPRAVAGRPDAAAPRLFRGRGGRRRALRLAAARAV